eukprot:scaffold88061_cov60-Phaeocystis_antarctica.AAC.2
MPPLWPTPPLQFDVMKSIACEAGFPRPSRRLAIVTESGESSCSTPPPDQSTSSDWATTGNCGRDDTPEPREDQRRARPLGRDDSPDPRLLGAAEGSSTIGGVLLDAASPLRIIVANSADACVPPLHPSVLLCSPKSHWTD